MAERGPASSRVGGAAIPARGLTGYALSRLLRAVQTARQHADPAVRARAEAKAERWQKVLAHMASGKLQVGSRTPLEGTPAWVTLEVAHGGFATGRYLAEQPLDEDEQRLLARIPAEVPGQTDRARINTWFLSDHGSASLADRVESGRYRIDVPEEGALCVMAWLLAQGDDAAALELMDALEPWMHRLRMAPRPEPEPRPAGASVCVAQVGETADVLLQVRDREAITAMREALSVWNPLYDRLVALWLDTVEGAPPSLAAGRASSGRGAFGRGAMGEVHERDDHERMTVIGGWPCRHWPDDWVSRRVQWLADYEAARAVHRHCGKHAHPKSNFRRLREALQRCPRDSSALSGREVGWIRRCLANTVTRQGAPGSSRRQALRRVQAEVAARPRFSDLATVLGRRMLRFKTYAGLHSMDAVNAPVADGESELVAAGVAMPAHLLRKAERALEAPIEELVERGIIGSSEVLARVLPQITAQVAAAGIADRALRELYGQIYTAFRRRRSLLLLNLEHQVRIEELPWVAALAPYRESSLSSRAQARQTMEQVVMLTLASFPQTIIPNPLVQELETLGRRAELWLPMLAELAADIFTGAFNNKWVDAAQRCGRLLHNTLYDHYYDLSALHSIHGVEAFAKACRQRAREAHVGTGSRIAHNGAVIEQSQILTSHNLATLVAALDLQAPLAALAPALAQQIFRWIIARQTQSLGHARAQLQMLKNTAYAWRQAIFLLSLCDQDVQQQAVDALDAAVHEQGGAWSQRFAPAVLGLRWVAEGGRFDEQGYTMDEYGYTLREPRGRRFLGWSVGQHWLWQ